MRKPASWPVEVPYPWPEYRQIGEVAAGNVGTVLGLPEMLHSDLCRLLRQAGSRLTGTFYTCTATVLQRMTFQVFGGLKQVLVELQHGQCSEDVSK